LLTKLLANSRRLKDFVSTKWILMEQTTLLYDERFLDTYAGSIIKDPATAIVELVANSWDAYATVVEITWPTNSVSQRFKIKDNGHGMTLDEFRHIWRTLAYNRITGVGNKALPPKGITGQPRSVFGKNGKGRFASFCFAKAYLVTSRKNGYEFVCRVSTSATEPLVIEEISHKQIVSGRGTEIEGYGEIPFIAFSEEKARELIGSRFLANPAFKVSINGSPITFRDIPSLLSEVNLDVPGYGNVRILHIDTQKADKTTKLHGIAWWVHGRAVGECKWSGSDYTRILDGRSSEAKRFTFIVQADFLNEGGAIREDWSGFNDESVAWTTTRATVQDRIRQIILDEDSAKRETTRASVIERLGVTINKLSPVSKERVQSFVNEIVDTCPNFGEQEIVQLSSVLAKLEQSKSRYGLLNLLHDCLPDDYDQLHTILKEWTIGMAKIVLDEIQNRLKLISELESKLGVVGVDEVHELQPLFEQGLWMFGAQFESIDFTSNVGMTKVLKTIFKDPIGRGSRNRPDFVVLPDASIGFYSRPSYDENNDENGVEHLIIIDLKTTGLHIGAKEKDQVWKYVKELRQSGHLRSTAKIDGFILGDRIDLGEEEPRTEGDAVKIYPVLYGTILKRAEKRLLNLHTRVKQAPFLLEQRQSLDDFLNPIQIRQAELEPEIRE
jgi:hypothetical protein